MFMCSSGSLSQNGVPGSLVRQPAAFPERRRSRFKVSSEAALVGVWDIWGKSTLPQDCAQADQA